MLGAANWGRKLGGGKGLGCWDYFGTGSGTGLIRLYGRRLTRRRRGAKREGNGVSEGVPKREFGTRDISDVPFSDS
jgi:hypothetical protein